MRQGIEIRVRETELTQLPLQLLFAGDTVVILLQFAEPLPHLGTRSRRGQITQRAHQPVAAGCRLAAGDDLDLHTGLQRAVEGINHTIDLGAAAAMTHFGVDPVGEVESGGAMRKIHYMPLGSEHINPLRSLVDTQIVLHPAAAQFLVPLQHLPQPGDTLLVIAARRVFPILVTPMGTEPELGLVMHVLGADLNFHHPSPGPDHRGVQRAIAVALRRGDIVVELGRNVAPQAVDDAQNRVAVADFGNQHPHRANVVDLGKSQPLVLHLFPDAVDVLGATADLGMPAELAEGAFQGGDHLVDIVLPIGTLFFQQLGDAPVLRRFQIAKGEILQLPFQVPDSQAMREGRVDIEDLARHPPLAFGTAVAHCVQGPGAFGDLDQGDAHVLDHRHQHGAQLGGLLRRLHPQHPLLGGAAQLADHGHALHTLDEPGHLVADLLPDPLHRNQAAPHGAVTHPRRQPLGIHEEFREDPGDLDAGAQHRRGLAGNQLGGGGHQTGLARVPLRTLREPADPVRQRRIGRVLQLRETSYLNHGIRPRPASAREKQVR